MLTKKNHFQSLIPFLCLLISLIFFSCIYSDIITIKNLNSFLIPIVLTIALSFYIFITNKNIISLGSSMFIYFYSVITLLGFVVFLPIIPNLYYLRSDFYMDFLNYPELNKAISLSCIGLNIFVLSTCIFSNTLENKNLKQTKVLGKGFRLFSPQSNKETKLIGNVALILQLISLLYFIVFIFRNGFGNIYANFHSSAANSGVYGHALIIMAFSVTTVFSIGSKRQIKTAIFLFILSSIIHLSVGNRGEIYYPLLAILAIYHKRGGTFRLKTILVGFFGSLLLISTIRFIRVGGLTSNSFHTLINSFNPISAIGESIGEMGLQISTVTYVLRYLNTGGKFQFGSTILYSFQVFFSRYIPFLPYSNFLSPASIRPIMPIDNLGFTSLGEAYFNFGFIGVVLFLLFLSFYFVYVDFKETNIYFKIFNGMFLVWILTWIRNTSSSMPSYIAWMLFLLIGYYLIINIFQKNR